ncbi:MAG: DUF4062 domain-containing protein [Thermomicrobiales bacterium]
MDGIESEENLLPNSELLSTDRPTILASHLRLRIFLSSTIDELAPERQVARRAIEQLCQNPVFFESGARAHSPRSVYRALLEQSDIFVGIYWQSYGWIAPDMEISGIEDEYLLSRSKPQFIYIKEPAPDRDPKLTTLLKVIKDKGDVVYQKFETIAELEESLANDLALFFAERFRVSFTTHSPSRRQTLPHLPAPFIGREEAVAQGIAVLQRSDVRLVTLVGPGGIGKTRLALEIGRQLEGDFEDGGAFVDLASLSDPSLVPSVILQTLNLEEKGARAPIDRLKEYLGSKALLLILDNFEHLLAAAPTVSILLNYCKNLTVLATSRAPLRIEGEQEIPVSPMELPNLESLPPIEVLAHNESIALLVHHVTAIRPTFALDNESAQIAAKICVLLDGLPLAIELAAARLRFYSELINLLNALENRLAVLVGGRRDAPARHQTMRNTISWSYDLLTPDQQALFRRLWIFSGGFTIKAIEAITRMAGPRDIEVIGGVEALIEASLLQTDGGIYGEPRFSMLQTLRDFALERARDNGEIETIERAHAEFFGNLVYELSVKYEGIPHSDWMNRLEVENSNLRTALAWTVRQEDPGLLIQLAWNLWRFWDVRGYISEGRNWVRQALLRSETAEPFVRADLLAAAGILASRQREFDEATNFLLGALREWIILEQSDMQVQTLLQLAKVETDQANFDDASVYFEQAERIAHDTEDNKGQVLARVGLGGIAVSRRDFVNAHNLLDPALQILREWGSTGDAAALGSCLDHLARLAHYEGDLDAAVAYRKESQRLNEQTGDTRGQVSGLLEGARLVQQQGNSSHASELRLQSLRLSERIEDPFGVAYSKMEMGRFDPKLPNIERIALLKESLEGFLALGDFDLSADSLDALGFVHSHAVPERAVACYAAADVLREQSSANLLNDTDAKRRRERIDALREQLGDQQFAKASDTGRQKIAPAIENMGSKGAESTGTH